MAPQNRKGQALVEMALVLSMFLLFFMFVQKSAEYQKAGFKKWKIGHDSKIRFKKND